MNREGRMEEKRETEKKQRGRPPLPMPELIPDTPENVMRAIVNTPPKKEWRYLKQAKP